MHAFGDFGTELTGIPTSFKYFDNLADRDPGSPAAALSRLSRSKITPLPGSVACDLGRDRNRGDDLSDTFIENAFASGALTQAREQVERALADGIDAVADPLPGLTELFAHLDSEPDWLDWERVERGARVFRRYGTDAFRFFGVISIAGYRIEMIHKPLVLTGAYTGGTAFGRYLETCKFWTEVSEPYGLRSGHEGRKTAVLVRILHSIIRHHIAPHPEWDTERLGIPLSQNAQFGPISTSFMLNKLLAYIGYRVSDADILDHMHFWRYVGYLMGVEPAFYPESIADWWSTINLLVLQDVSADGSDSRKLGQSFIDAFGAAESDTPEVARRKNRERRVVLGWTRLFLDPGSYRAMELGPAGLYRLAPLLRLLPNAVDRIRIRFSAHAADRIDDRQRRRRRAWLDAQTLNRPAKFAPVEKLSR